MQTLTQYQYLDRDFILRGVVDWMVMESPMLKALPMKSVSGNAYKYNVSTALPNASWQSVGQPITESTGSYVQRTADIYTLIQNAYTDKSQIALNATQNPETIDAELAAQAMAHEFEKTFIMGQTSDEQTSKQFKGILRLIAELESESTTTLNGSTDPGEGANSQVLVANATSGAVTMNIMDGLVDMVKPGKPDVLLMSKRARRKLTQLQRASGGATAAGLLLTDENKFGIKMETYDHIPIYVSEWVPDNMPDASSSVVTIATMDWDKTRSTNYDNTAIFALQLGDDKLTGLHAGEMTHERETLVEDYNAILNRYVWYIGLALVKKYSAAVLLAANPDD